MWIAGVVALILIALALYEYRIRKPDQLVLHEVDGTIRVRTRLFYPRHFSLALPGTTRQVEAKVDSVARGGVQIRTTIAVTVAPSRDHLASLVRVGGWNQEAPIVAAKLFDTVIQGIVKSYTESQPFEELSSDQLAKHLSSELKLQAQQFGLEVVSLAVQAVDATDPEIAEAVRRREASRILEQTELLNQKARVAAALAKLRADEQIALSEHELELKRFDLRKAVLEQEASLAEQRTADELKRNRMKLAFESEELALLKSSPELLLLSPQAARLAEASQDLKNARVIVSLGSTDAERTAGLPAMFRRFLTLMLEGEKQPPPARED